MVFLIWQIYKVLYFLRNQPCVPSFSSNIFEIRPKSLREVAKVCQIIWHFMHFAKLPNIVISMVLVRLPQSQQLFHRKVFRASFPEFIISQF